MENFKKIILMTLTLFMLVFSGCGQAEVVSNLKSFDDTKTALLEKSAELEKYMEYFTEVESVDNASDLIKLYNSSFEGTGYTYTLYDDSDYFLSAYITFTDSEGNSLGTSDVFMAVPYQYNEYVAEVTAQPSNYVVEEYKFYDFSYLKPEYEYGAYRSYDKYGDYTLYYSEQANVNLENFKNLVQRQYVMDLTTSLETDRVFFIDSTNNQMEDHETYSQYNQKLSTYYAELNLTEKTITVYTLENSKFVETETITME